MNRYTTKVIFILCMLCTAPGFAQHWERLTAIQESPAGQGSFAAYYAHPSFFRNLLEGLPRAATSLILPAPDGHMTEFILEETHILKPGPGMMEVPVHTFSGYSSDKSSLIHLTLYKNKLSGIVLQGDDTWYISTPDPQPDGSNPPGTIHIFDRAARPEAGIPMPVCGKDDPVSLLPEELIGQKPTLTPSTGCSLRIYRLAVACTGEFTNASGSQANAIANLTALINTVNAIFERELGVQFTMVTNNNLIYTDPATDPFDQSQSSCNQVTPSQTSFSNNLNSADYDIGITVFYTPFGGCASGGACGASKGACVSGNNSLDPNSYLGEVTAHELGHKLGANHSHNSSGAGCSFNPAGAWEVGGGSTIMSYAPCPPSYPSYNTFLYFHGGSLNQMKTFLASAAGSCYTTGTVNTTPAISTPSNDTFFIPVSTPFRLYANATDAEDNNLLYAFEQMDQGTGTTSMPASTDAAGPVIRSFQPSAKAYRYIPRIDSLRANIYPSFEVLPSISRLLTFWTTVRDNHPGCGCSSVDTFLVKTAGSSPFLVTSQGNPVTVASNASLTVTWNVAATNQAPFSTQSVQLLFAADGVNYNTVLLDSVPNNGSATVTLPNVNTQKGRIMVAARGNLFFDINNADITIQSPCSTVQESAIWPRDAISAMQGASVLQTNLIPIYGQGIDTFAGAIETTDPDGVIGFHDNVTQGCRTNIGYRGKYDLYRFRVAQPGTYTIGRTLYTLNSSPAPFMTVYNSGPLTLTTAGGCNNYINSSAAIGANNNVGVGSSVTFTGACDSVYAVAILKQVGTGFGTYRINISGPAQVYPEAQTAVGSYAFLVVNSAGTIIDISAASPGLQSQPPGSYLIYGIAYSPSLNLTPYLNQPFSDLANASFGSTECISISTNSVAVNITPANPLPVDYIQLAAVKDRNAARLTWLAPGSGYITRFRVEESNDGKTFVPIADLDKEQCGAGTDQYRYLYTPGTTGDLFYRIRGDKTDGKWLYSNIAMIVSGNPQGLKVVPNPAASTISVFAGTSSLPLPVTLCDMTGRVIKRFTMNSDHYTLDISSLSPGVYMLAGKGFAEKVVKK